MSNFFTKEPLQKKIFVKTIPRETATKVHEFRNVDKYGAEGEKMNKTKVSDNCKTALSPLYNRKLGALNTGLHVYIENPWTNEELSEIPPEFKDVASQDKILLQHALEIKHGRPKGYYTNKAWTNKDKFDPDQITFFQDFKYKMNDGTTVLDMSNPIDELAYYFFLATKYVANSEKSWRNKEFPHALFYIAVESESDDIKYQKRERRDKAISRLQSEEMDSETRKKFAKILQLAKNPTAKQSYNLLSDFIETAKDEPANSIDRFNELYDLLVDPAGRTEFEARYFLQDLLDNWVVTEKQGSYFWPAKGLEIGSRYKEAVEFLMNPNKQEEQDQLREALEAKKS